MRATMPFEHTARHSSDVRTYKKNAPVKYMQLYMQGQQHQKTIMTFNGFQAKQGFPIQTCEDAHVQCQQNACTAPANGQQRLQFMNTHGTVKEGELCPVTSVSQYT